MKTEFTATQMGNTDVGSEQFEQSPYSSTVGDGPSWPLGHKTVSNPGPRPDGGASGDQFDMVRGAEFQGNALAKPFRPEMCIAPSAPDLRPTITPAPGSPLIVKLSALARAIFGRE